MDIIKLKTFCTVAKLGSFTRAAEKLFFTQPAISLQIKDLENEYRCRLFERFGRKIGLTRAGEALLPYAEEIVESARKAREAVRAVHETRGGRMKIGATGFTGVHILPELAAGFRRKHPEITMDIRLGYAAKIRKAVLKGKLDAAVVGGNPDTQGDPRFEERILLEDRIVAVVGTSHRLWGRTEADIGELAGEPAILLPKITLSRRIVQKHFDLRGIPLRVEYEIRNIEMIKRMVEAGLGISFLCKSQIRREYAAGTLNAVSLSGPGIPRTISFISLRNRETASALSLLYDYLEEFKKELKETLSGES